MDCIIFITFFISPFSHPFDPSNCPSGIRFFSCYYYGIIIIFFALLRILINKMYYNNNNNNNMTTQFSLILCHAHRKEFDYLQSKKIDGIFILWLSVSQTQRHTFTHIQTLFYFYLYFPFSFCGFRVVFPFDSCEMIHILFRFYALWHFIVIWVVMWTWCKSAPFTLDLCINESRKLMELSTIAELSERLDFIANWNDEKCIKK